MKNKSPNTRQKSEPKSLIASRIKPRRYQLRALGFCMEASAHQLNEEEVKEVEAWCETSGCATDEISGNLEEVLEDYDCYSTNLWQSNLLPILDSVRLVVVDNDEVEIFTIDKPYKVEENSNQEGSHRVDRNNEDILIYIEESKGLAGTWVLDSTTTPLAEDFTILTNTLVIDGDQTRLISGIKYQKNKLEQDFEAEDIRGKAAYSMLL